MATNRFRIHSGAALRWTKRRVEILEWVDILEGCILAHLFALLWTGAASDTNCYRNVLYLTRHGYLVAHRLVALNDVGTGPNWYTVGAPGRRVLEDLGITPRTKRAAGLTPRFAQHEVGLRHCRVMVECAARTSIESGAADSLATYEWTSESHYHQRPLNTNGLGSGALPPLIPDGGLDLRFKDGHERTFFFEFDNSSLREDRIREKIRLYLDWVRASGRPTPILFVVPDERRQGQIIAWVVAETQRIGASPEYVWITCHPAMSAESVLAQPIWRVAGTDRTTALLSRTASSPHVDA